MPADPVFCTSCGNHNQADARFCESCGARLEAAATPATAPPPPARPRRSRRLVALIAAVLLAGAGLVFARPIIRFLQLQSILSSKEGAPTPSDSTEEAGPVSAPAADRIIVTKPPSLGSRPAAAGEGTIATGSVLTLRSGERVCSNSNSEGDSFSARVQRAVAGSGGARIPQGTVVTLVVDRATRAELTVSVQSIELGNTTYHLGASIDTVELRSTGPDGLAQMPVLPTDLPPGAVVTRAVGGDADRCIEPNALIRIRLREDLVLMP